MADLPVYRFRRCQRWKRPRCGAAGTRLTFSDDARWWAGQLGKYPNEAGRALKGGWTI
jgi:hypothetical protein